MKANLVLVILLITLMNSSVNPAVTNVTGQVFEGRVSGAIFTTTVDGSIVNENVHYAAKEDVYLDGGPGPHAPSTAAGLKEADYYFQVTDPSGKDLLSTDHISCRMIHVNENGVISYVYPGTNWERSKGNWVPVDCQHNQGVDQDHSELGAITVQLFPYDDTPNPGGVYKVWITPIDKYTLDPNYMPTANKDQANNENYSPGNYHGFVPAWSKTDNYKVEKHGKPYISPVITVQKFHDKNINGVQDVGEESISGWAVDVTDPLGVTNTVYTEAMIDASVPGTYTLVESTPVGTIQTVSLLDGQIVSFYPNAAPTVDVNVAGDSEETHLVVYGNVGTGSVTACKVYDTNGNGIADVGEEGVAGWMMNLTGVTVTGEAYGPDLRFTGSDGCVTYTDLLPGTYNIAEVMPSNEGWTASSSLSQTVVIESSLDGSDVHGTAVAAVFTNYYVGMAAFGTKGYWHNKNGLTELTANAWIIGYVNGLEPYMNPSSYFEACDEPFDGMCADGPVAAAFNNDDGSLIWGAGTWQAEVSHFLIDSNAGGDAREQLAQQLLAFIFNVQLRLGGTTAMIWDGSTWVSAQGIIDEAISAWLSTDATWQHTMEMLLDAFNNNDEVIYLNPTPGPIVY